MNIPEWVDPDMLKIEPVGRATIHNRVIFMEMVDLDVCSFKEHVPVDYKTVKEWLDDTGFLVLTYNTPERKKVHDLWFHNGERIENVVSYKNAQRSFVFINEVECTLFKMAFDI